MVAATGCPTSELPVAPIPAVASGKVRVRVFTEPAPVRLATALGKYTFVATDNELARYDDKGAVAGLVPGTRFIALAADAERAQLWILTDVGIGHYDIKTETYSELVAPPTPLGIDYAQLAKDGATIEPASDGGVWLGTARGLFYASPQGGWVATPITDPIRGLGRDRAGYLWIATHGGVLARKPTGETVRVTAAEGLAIAEPRLVVPLAADRMLVVGADDQGHERIAIGKQLNWVTYRALPAIHFDAAVARDTAALAMGAGRVYRISTDAHAERPLTRDAVRLVPLVGTPIDDWAIAPLDLALPSGATMLAVADDQLLVGTRDLGVARYRVGDTQPMSWLRRKQMFVDAMTLTVACARRDDCWVATGVHQAWHWVGDHFVPGGPDEVVLAVVREPTTGAIYALHRASTDSEVHVSRIDGTTWTPLSKIAVATPGEQPEISFARFTSSGALWIGLRYRDGLERRPYGIAIIEPASGKVSYHHTEDAADGPPVMGKMLPIPMGVVDADVRGSDVWFATSEGVGRLANGKIKMWSEADGLRSELARAVTIANDGSVIVATGAGAAVWDGKAWDFPAALQFEINDVVATHNGQIWMATERGIAAWDGKKVRRVDTRRGLAENLVLDVAADQFDRIWARGPASLTLIAQ